MVQETPLYADGTRADERAVHWLYTPGGLAPVARYSAGRLHYVVTDHLGTPRELLTESGKLAWASRHETWGRTQRWRLPAANDGEAHPDCALRFPGQYLDNESGLHYNRFRYYDPDTGQYLSPDPIGLLGGLNLYSYAPNPLSYIDPLGLTSCPSKGIEQPDWTPHGYKHFPQKNTSWKDIVKSTKSGPAKYKSGIDIRTLEYDVFNSGIPVANGKPWKVKDSREVIGASEGKESQWVRVELSGGTIHGHPISLEEFLKLTKP